MGAGAASILVDLVLSTGSSRNSVGNASASFEVIADDANTLTKNVVIDLIIGASNLYGSWSSGRCSVGGSLRSNSSSLFRSISKGVRSCTAAAIDVLVGLVLHSVDAAAGYWHAL